MGERDVQRLFKPQGLKTPTVVLVMETFYMYQKIGKVIRYKKIKHIELFASYELDIISIMITL